MPEWIEKILAVLMFVALVAAGVALNYLLDSGCSGAQWQETPTACAWNNDDRPQHRYDY